MGALAGRRVLLVEDEPIIALDLAMILEGQGVAVLGPAMSVGEALTLLDEPALDAVVLDGLLGKEPAWAIADILAQRQVPFLLMTGLGTMIPPAHGHAPTLAKPVEADELLRQLVRLTPCQRPELA
jgi:CheY-like chemotaxis protein